MQQVVIPLFQTPCSLLHKSLRLVLSPNASPVKACVNPQLVV